MPDKYTYSPLPIKAYRAKGVRQSEVDTLIGDEREAAAWNLFWLSTPTIDFIPRLGANWWKSHQPMINGLAAVISDVYNDELIYRKLMMHPQSFHDWFEREEDKTLYDCYEKLGGDLWVRNVLERSHEAAERRLMLQPPITFDGNVLHVNFRKTA